MSRPDRTVQGAEEETSRRKEEKLRRDLKTQDQAEKNNAPVDFVKLVILSCNKE